MVCSVCNATISEGALFCTGCGTRVNAQIPASAPAAPVSQIPQAPASHIPPAQAMPNVAPAPVAPVAAPSSDKGVNFDFSQGTQATGNTQKLYQYKVLSQKDKWFSGKFDPMVLEQAINAYAQQGWRVIGCATADIPGFGNARQEFITLLEREM